MFGFFEELFHRSRNLSHVDLKCCVGFSTPFSWRFRKEWDAKVNFRFDFSLIYFLFRLFKHTFSWNKRHISSLEKLITGLWSPDIILYGLGKQKRELTEVVQSILQSSARELNAVAYDTLLRPLCLWVLPHRLLLFVCVFIASFHSKATWLSIWREAYVWHDVIFKDAYFNEVIFFLAN